MALPQNVEIDRTVRIPFDDGETRPVLLSMLAKIEAEGAVRQLDGSPTPFYVLADTDSHTARSALLWAGLRAADATLRTGTRALTLEQVAEMMEHITPTELAYYLSLALVLADHRTTEEQRGNARRLTQERIEAYRQELIATAPPPISDASPSDLAG